METWLALKYLDPSGLMEKPVQVFSGRTEATSKEGDAAGACAKHGSARAASKSSSPAQSENG